MVKPAVTYGSETWLMTGYENNEYTSMEGKCFREDKETCGRIENRENTY
jgi:hypothetical protein